MKTPITVQLAMQERDIALTYKSVDSLLNDLGLKALFDQNLIVNCEVLKGKKRVIRTPFMTWDRFQKQVITNAQALLEL